MDFFEVVNRRRSVRQFSEDNVPESVVQKALEAAVLAPNSSNTQTWDFYWTSRGSQVQSRLVEACLSQGAAKTSSHLIVVTADPRKWRRSQPQILKFLESQKVPPSVLTYYSKLIPWMYRMGPLGILGWVRTLSFALIGLVRPIMRGPGGYRDQQEVAVKSAALACENFVLAITAQGAATCMMEGFDAVRVRRALNLPRCARVVMVIAVGHPTPRGLWGDRYRIPLDQVVHRRTD